MSVAAAAESEKRTDQSDSDQAAGGFPPILSKAEIKRFSELSAPRFFCALALDVLIIALSVIVSMRLHSLAVYLLAVVLIGSRLHAFAILMHEATHYRAARTRWLNDAIGEILALPVLIKLTDYRRTHFAHHRHVNTAEDPDWVRKLGDNDFVYPKSKLGIFLTLVPFASGLKFFSLLYKFTRQSKRYREPKSTLGPVAIVRAGFFVVLAVFSIYLSFWQALILYWIIPLLSASMVFFHIRSVAEHFAIEYDHAFNQTRTVVSPWWEAWLFAPHAVNYHLEHHLYPSVPFYRLPEVHRRLMASEDYRKKAHITRGYLGGLLRECSGLDPVSRGPSSANASATAVP